MAQLPSIKEAQSVQVPNIYKLFYYLVRCFIFGVFFNYHSYLTVSTCYIPKVLLLVFSLMIPYIFLSMQFPWKCILLVFHWCMPKPLIYIYLTTSPMNPFP